MPRHLLAKTLPGIILASFLLLVFVLVGAIRSVAAVPDLDQPAAAVLLEVVGEGTAGLPADDAYVPAVTGANGNSLLSEFALFASSEADEPPAYLLADYAQQCKAYMGTVPEFSCATGNAKHDNALFAVELPVDKKKGKCPRLVDIDKECSIGTSVAGMLRPQSDAPSGTDVMMVFRCRKYDIETPDGFFDDMAVIQHDKNTGNTCWFQVPTLAERTENGKLRYDAEGNIVYKDFDGSKVVSPMAIGAEELWLHPYHPTDPRGYVANKNCQRCHDADPFIWTPYLEPAFEFTVGGRTIIASKEQVSETIAWPGTGKNYIPDFLGIFEADGRERPQPYRINPVEVFSSTTGLACGGCHGFGQNTMKALVLGSEDDDSSVYVNRHHQLFAGPQRGELRKISSLINIIFSDAQLRDEKWMPPKISSGYDDLLKEVAIGEATKPIEEWLRSCAEDPGQVYCQSVKPVPQTVAGLDVNVAAVATSVGSGSAAGFTVRLRNLPRMQTIAPGSLSVTGVLSDGTNSVQSAAVVVNAPLQAWSELNVPVSFDVPDLFAAGHATATFEISRTASDVDINLAAVRMETTVDVTDRADLALAATGELVADPATPREYGLRYDVTISNQGIAAAAAAGDRSAPTLSITLPNGARFDANASSFFCQATTGTLVRCDLQRLDAGKQTLARIVATRSRDKGPIALLTATADYANDANPDNNRVDFPLMDEDALGARLFLPSIQQAPPSVDLVVQSLSVDERGVTVVVANIGDDSLPHGANFWVDVYLDPELPPRGVNQIGDRPRTNGLVWGVLDGAVDLAPGETLRLTTNGKYFFPGLSDYPDLIPAGAAIYAQVDSANTETGYGAVLESHERTGAGYNNIAAVTTESDISTGRWR